MSLQPLHVYRKLLRSAAQAFKSDVFMLTAAQAEIRSKFEESRGVTDQGELQELLETGSQTADFIRTSIVQAQLNDHGAYEMTIGEDQVGGLVEEVTPDMKLPRERKKKKPAE